MSAVSGLGAGQVGAPVWPRAAKNKPRFDEPFDSIPIFNQYFQFGGKVGFEEFSLLCAPVIWWKWLVGVWEGCLLANYPGW